MFDLLNFNELIEDLIFNPIFLSLLLTGFIGFLYYLGWIISANNWQYQTTTREGKIYLGFYFMSGYFFIPSLVLFSLIIILKLKNGFDEFLSSVHYSIYFILLIIIFILFFDIIDRKFQNKLKKFEKDTWKYSSIIKHIVIKFLFIVLNYGIIISTKNNEYTYFILFVLIWIDLLVLSKWARLSTLNNQSAEAKIKFKNNEESMNVRLIEFLENGTLIKVQKKIKDEIQVFAIPISEIKFIELLTDVPKIKLFGFEYDKKSKKIIFNRKNDKK